MKKEAEYSCETSVPAYWTIWCHNPAARHFNPEEGGNMSLENVGIRILDYMVSIQKPEVTSTLKETACPLRNVG
jgi:hypothetical protein